MSEQQKPELENLDTQPEEHTPDEAEVAGGGTLLQPTRSLDLQVTPIKTTLIRPTTPYAEGNSQPPNIEQ